MTLLEDCKALVENRDNWIFTDKLRDIIRRHEHDDWKGPWKCEKCGFISSRDIRHYEIRQGCMTDDFCDGNWIPYERRRSDRRRA